MRRSGAPTCDPMKPPCSECPNVPIPYCIVPRLLNKRMRATQFTLWLNRTRWGDFNIAQFWRAKHTHKNVNFLDVTPHRTHPKSLFYMKPLLYYPLCSRSAIIFSKWKWSYNFANFQKIGILRKKFSKLFCIFSIEILAFWIVVDHKNPINRRFLKPLRLIL